MSRTYIEPLLRPKDELADPISFQNTDRGFESVRIHERGVPVEVASAFDLDDDRLEAFTTMPQSPFAAERALVMGIVNVTPDSFSDGGQFLDGQAAFAHAQFLIDAGATILDFGAESTRPGAQVVPVADELARLEPVFEKFDKLRAIISVDTRKAEVAKAAIDAGAHIINDISAMTFDDDMAATVAASNATICLMHSQGSPKTMQDAPKYDDVVMDIYDFLSDRIAVAEAAGIPRNRIMVDPGIGFGKTLAHNLAILRHLAVFHGLGCPLLLGASRKSMIAKIDQNAGEARLGGSLSIALDAVNKGAHILRVHDVQETVQALRIAHRINETVNDT